VHRETHRSGLRPISSSGLPPGNSGVSIRARRSSTSIVPLCPCRDTRGARPERELRGRVRTRHSTRLAAVSLRARTGGRAGGSQPWQNTRPKLRTRSLPRKGKGVACACTHCCLGTRGVLHAETGSIGNARPAPTSSGVRTSRAISPEADPASDLPARSGPTSLAWRRLDRPERPVPAFGNWPDGGARHW
jgi:hypothetical protein